MVDGRTAQDVQETQHSLAELLTRNQVRHRTILTLLAILPLLAILTLRAILPLLTIIRCARLFTKSNVGKWHVKSAVLHPMEQPRGSRATLFTTRNARVSRVKSVTKCHEKTKRNARMSHVKSVSKCHINIVFLHPMERSRATLITTRNARLSWIKNVKRFGENVHIYSHSFERKAIHEVFLTLSQTVM